MRHIPAAAALATAALFAGWDARADTVSLTSRDGSVEITGDLLSFDGRYYRVDSAYGVVTLDAQAAICTGEGCPVPGEYVPELLVSGAGDGVASLLPPLLEAFALSAGYGFVRQDEDPTHFLYLLLIPEEERRVARVRFRLTTSQEGFADLLAEQADFAMAMRPPTAAEAALAEDAGIGVLTSDRQSMVLATDALVPLASPDNPTRDVALSDLRAVLAGDVADWSEIGGPDGAISLHLPATGRGTLDRIRDSIGAVAADVTYHDTLDGLASAVSEDAQALGVTLLSATEGARILPLRGACGGAQIADETSVATGDYPLTVSFTLHVPARRQIPVARAFQAFLETPEAQEIMAEAGFAAHRITATPLADQGEWLLAGIRASGPDVTAETLREVTTALDGAERLSVSVRFVERNGVQVPDRRSREALDALASAVRAGAFADGRLIFAGFSDAEGGAAANAEASRARAEAARDAFQALFAAGESRPAVEVTGLGEAMPRACNDGWGARINRRVEVWHVQR